MAHPHQNLYVTPSTLEVDYDRNLTELYQAITDQKWDRAVTICKKHPVQAATWVVRHYEDDGEIMWRFLPIHSACARQPPAHVVQALLKAYPDGAKCIDDQGMYALHYACGNQASRDVIRLLLVNFPEAAKIPDPRGMLPIHYLACWGPSSVSVVDMLLVANREVANVRDEEGNTPLDLAKEGDYPERHAVMAALRKWINDNASMRTSNSNANNSILQGAASSSIAQMPSMSSYSASKNKDSGRGIGRNNSFTGRGGAGGYTMDQLTLDTSVDDEEKKNDDDVYYGGGHYNGVGNSGYRSDPPRVGGRGGDRDSGYRSDPPRSTRSSAPGIGPSLSSGGNLPPQPLRDHHQQNQDPKHIISPTQVERLEEQVRMLKQQLGDVDNQSKSGNTTKSRYSTGASMKGNNDNMNYSNNSSPAGSPKASTPHSLSRHDTGRHHVAYAESSGDEMGGSRRSRVIGEDDMDKLQKEIQILQAELERKHREERDLEMERDALKDAWKLKYENSERRYREDEKVWKQKFDDMKKKAEDRENELLRDIRRTEEDIMNLRRELDSAKEIAELKNKTASEKEIEIEDLQRKLEASKSERDGLRMTLGDLMEQHDNFKKKSLNLTDRLGSLSVSLESMMDQQRALTKALQARNEQYRDVFKKRQEKLKELEELEKSMEKDEDKLEGSLEKQMKEMEAIAAVIAAARE